MSPRAQLNCYHIAWYSYYTVVRAIQQAYGKLHFGVSSEQNSVIRELIDCQAAEENAIKYIVLNCLHTFKI